MRNEHIYLFLLLLFTGVPTLLLLVLSVRSFGDRRAVSGITWLLLSAIGLLLTLFRVENPQGSFFRGRPPWEQIGTVRQFIDGVGFSLAAGGVTFFTISRWLRRRTIGNFVALGLGLLVFLASSVILGSTRNFSLEPQLTQGWHWLALTICVFGSYHVWNALAGLTEWERQGPAGLVLGTFFVVTLIASASHGVSVLRGLLMAHA